MNKDERIKTIVKALYNKKAEDIKVIEITDLTIIADHFIIANGNSTTQTRALADEVDFRMAQLGIKPTRTEGYNGSSWIVIDYSDIVVHVFYKETREFYQLERLWADGKMIDVTEYCE